MLDLSRLIFLPYNFYIGYTYSSLKSNFLSFIINIYVQTLCWIIIALFIKTIVKNIIDN